MTKETVTIKYGIVIKTIILVVVLIVASALFGMVCRRVYQQYEVLFAPGQALLDLAIRVFGTIGLVVIAAAVVATLVRPPWAMFVAFALSALAMILLWEVSILTLALGFVYLALASIYARSVAAELDKRIEFSVRAIREAQGALLLALAMLIGVSFALGYRDDSAKRGFIIPPAYKQTMRAFAMPSVQVEIDKQGSLGPAEQAAALAQAQREFDNAITGLEMSLRPNTQLIPIVLALMLIWVLENLMGLIEWIPRLVLSGIFPLLERLGVTQVVTETREIKRLILRM